MEQNDVAEYFWEVTVNEQGETGMNEECHKLDHLKGCQVPKSHKMKTFHLYDLTLPLPPEIFLHSWAHC